MWLGLGVRLEFRVRGGVRGVVNVRGVVGPCLAPNPEIYVHHIL